MRNCIRVFLAAASLWLGGALSAQPIAGCGDCNGDMRLDVLDALAAARHASGLALLVSPGFDRCNVNGTPGGPMTPGTTVDVLDSLRLAQASVGLATTLSCTTPIAIIDPACGAASDMVRFTLAPITVGIRIDVTCQFSSDGGLTWNLATAGGGGSITTNPAIDVPATATMTFDWDSKGDGVGIAGPSYVAFRIDGVVGAIAGATTVELLIENRGGQIALSLEEQHSVAMLRAIAAGQERFRRRLIVDRDGDGIGEYGYLQELTGVGLHRTTLGGGLSTAPLAEPLLGTILGTSAATAGGIGFRDGYAFFIYLPTASGPAVSESAPVQTFTLPGDADQQEQRWICYAVPVDIHREHRRAFAINQQGVLFDSDNEDRQDYKALTNPPSAGSALVAVGAEDPDNLEGLLSAGIAATDGFFWVAVP